MAGHTEGHQVVDVEPTMGCVPDLLDVMHLNGWGDVSGLLTHLTQRMIVEVLKCQLTPSVVVPSLIGWQLLGSCSSFVVCRDAQCLSLAVAGIAPQRIEG